MSDIVKNMQDFQVEATGGLQLEAGSFDAAVDTERQVLKVTRGVFQAVRELSRQKSLLAQDFVEAVLFRADDLIRKLDWKPSEFEAATAQLRQAIADSGYDLPVAMDYPNRAPYPAPKR